MLWLCSLLLFIYSVLQSCHYVYLHWLYWTADRHCLRLVWVLVVAALTVFCSLCWCQQRNFVFQNKCGLYISCQTPAYVQYQSRTGTLFVKSLCGNSNPHDICYYGGYQEFRVTTSNDQPDCFQLRK